ncbi:hypothetical protein ABZ215_34815 [Amycolatopsis sp. NPDC006131]
MRAKHPPHTRPVPAPNATKIARYLAFSDEHVDVTLDGERVPRPVTPWS